MADEADMTSRVGAMSEDVAPRWELLTHDDRIPQVADLKLTFLSFGEALCSVSGMTFATYRCQTVSLVGEAKGGSSVTPLSNMRLIEPKATAHCQGRRAVGESSFCEVALLYIDMIRVFVIVMGLQELTSALNPVGTNGRQSEQVILYRVVSYWFSHDTEPASRVGKYSPSICWHSGCWSRVVLLSMPAYCSVC